MTRSRSRTTSRAPVAGIDRWRSGWVIAIGTTVVDRLLSAATVDEAFELTSPCDIVAIDMPIALPAAGRRRAETELRGRLGSAGRSVFTSPTRAAIDAPDQATATAMNRANGGPGISAQAWGLAASIRELRAGLRHSDRRERWFETHPETAFTILNGDEPLDSKRTGRGVGQRLALLRNDQPIHDLLCEAPPRVPVDDVLDAVAAWWSARRVAEGNAIVFGPTGPDDEGFERSIRV